MSVYIRFKTQNILCLNHDNCIMRIKWNQTQVWFSSVFEQIEILRITRPDWWTPRDTPVQSNNSMVIPSTDCVSPRAKHQASCLKSLSQGIFTIILQIGILKPISQIGKQAYIWMQRSNNGEKITCLLCTMVVKCLAVMQAMTEVGPQSLLKTFRVFASSWPLKWCTVLWALVTLAHALSPSAP